MKSRLLKILILVFCVSFALFAVSCKKNKKESAKESITQSTVESVVESDTAPESVFDSVSAPESGVESETTSESIIESDVESGEESETESQEESESVHECDYTELKYNSTHHWYECTCGAKDSSTEQVHAGGTATCTQKAVCTTCSQAYGSTLAHSYTELKYNSTHHWYECTCGAKDSSTEQAHAGGTATCTQKAVCTTCSQAYGSTLAHSYTELKYNSTHHWYECSCGKKSEEQLHAGGMATCQELAECTTCGQSYGESGGHSGGMATCEELAVCDVCREAYGTYGKHNMVEGECTVCGARESQGLEYELNADQTGYTVVGIGSRNYTDLIIPTTYKGKQVTSIGEDAFYSCYSLTSVEIPDSVTSIGDWAFSHCDSLTSVVIGDSVTSIGNYAFYSCGSLTSVEIPNSVTSIGWGAFSGCDSLTSIKVSENSTAYKSIDGNLYSKDGTVLIQYAIGKTDREFIIPNSVTSIGNYAFSWCDSLTSVVIGDGVTRIGEDAFYWCSSLTSVEIPDSVTSIGYYAFSGCDSLTSVVIGDSVTSIGYSAFASCGSLTSVVIGDSVTSIGWYAFSDCDSLTSVVIGDSVTSIGSSAFSWCDSLTSVYYKGTSSEWSSISKGLYNEDLTNATRYYYIENEADVPTGGGNYWHYVDGVPTEW